MERRRRRHHRLRRRQKYKIAIVAIFAIIVILIFSLIVSAIVKKSNKANAQKKLEAQRIEKEKKKQETANRQDKQLDAYIGKMTLEQKVAQMFFITPEALTGVDVADQAGKTTKKMLEKYPVGGLIYFSQNIEDEDQLTEMLEKTKSYSAIPLFIGVDEEGGSLVSRVAKSKIEVPKVQDMAEIGKTKDAKKAGEVGTTIGTYLSKLGFNLDFAPDADVLVNKKNTAIGVRSFGSDAKVDAKMVAAEVQALQAQNVSSVIKHFPGHGSTTEDSYEQAAIVNRSLKQLQKEEFLPFQSGIDAGADFVMVGHLTVPQVVDDKTPASMSKKMITEILRGDLKFDKIVITDSMSMKSITGLYKAEDAAVVAINAGADMVLMPQDFEKAYKGVLDAVKSGKIEESRINETVKRILLVKNQRLGLKLE